MLSPIAPETLILMPRAEPSSPTTTATVNTDSLLPVSQQLLVTTPLASSFLHEEEHAVATLSPTSSPTFSHVENEFNLESADVLNWDRHATPFTPEPLPMIMMNDDEHDEHVSHAPILQPTQQQQLQVQQIEHQHQNNILLGTVIDLPQVPISVPSFTSMKSLDYLSYLYRVQQSPSSYHHYNASSPLFHQSLKTSTSSITIRSARRQTWSKIQDMTTFHSLPYKFLVKITIPAGTPRLSNFTFLLFRQDDKTLVQDGVIAELKEKYGAENVLIRTHSCFSSSLCSSSSSSASSVSSSGSSSSLTNSNESLVASASSPSQQHQQQQYLFQQPQEHEFTMYFTTNSHRNNNSRFILAIVAIVADESSASQATSVEERYLSFNSNREPSNATNAAKVNVLFMSEPTMIYSRRRQGKSQFIEYVPIEALYNNSKSCHNHNQCNGEYSSSPADAGNSLVPNGKRLKIK